VTQRYGAIKYVSDAFIRDSAIDYKKALIWSVQGQAKRAGETPLDEGAEVEELVQRMGLEDWEHRMPEGWRAFRVTVRVEPRDRSQDDESAPATDP